MVHTQYTQWLLPRFYDPCMNSRGCHKVKLVWFLEPLSDRGPKIWNIFGLVWVGGPVWYTFMGPKNSIVLLLCTTNNTTIQVLYLNWTAWKAVFNVNKTQSKIANSFCHCPICTAFPIRSVQVLFMCSVLYMCAFMWHPHHWCHVCVPYSSTVSDHTRNVPCPSPAEPCWGPPHQAVVHCTTPEHGTEWSCLSNELGFGGQTCLVWVNADFPRTVNAVGLEGHDWRSSCVGCGFLSDSANKHVIT